MTPEQGKTVVRGGRVLRQEVTFMVQDDEPVMGTFEVNDGKITAWRDYFDLNQFASGMG